MFLKQKKPGMDDFERKKYFGSTGKKLEEFQYFKKNILRKSLTDTLAKISKQIFVYSLVSE